MAAGSIVPLRSVSGRPLAGEFADYAKPDIDLVLGDDAVEILTAQEQGTLALLAPLDETTAQGQTNAPGKGTLKEVVAGRLRAAAGNNVFDEGSGVRARC